MVFAEENSWPNMLLLAQIQLSSQKHDSERKSRPDKGTVNMAERVGFEPTIRLPVCRISSAVLSTTQPPLRLSMMTRWSARGVSYIPRQQISHSDCGKTVPRLKRCIQLVQRLMA